MGLERLRKSSAQEGLYKEVDECRACGSKNLETYFDFGEMPLVNSLELPSPSEKTRRFPLAVNFCHDCSLSQLTVSVNPEILFKNYPYRSSISESFGNHCYDLSEELNKELLKPEDLVVDIASNDGYLLNYFKLRGNKVLGIDPAENLARVANEKGIETLAKFWDEEISKEVLRKYGPAKVITAFNVFAHVPNLNSFTWGIKNLLDKNGYFIVESPHVQNLIENNEFDTIYHEHVSYLSAKSIKALMERNGLNISRAKKFPIHGGSIRFYINHKGTRESDGSLEEIISEEETKGIHSIGRYKELERKAVNIKERLNSILRQLKEDSRKVCGFGASAKGNILLNYCGVDNSLISNIFDDTPEKQGFIYPGTNIPILSRQNLNQINPDYLVLLAWNFASELIEKTKSFSEKGGKYLIPLPETKIVA